jgi:hypothetical protein
MRYAHVQLGAGGGLIGDDLEVSKALHIDDGEKGNSGDVQDLPQPQSDHRREPQNAPTKVEVKAPVGGDAGCQHAEPNHGEACGLLAPGQGPLQHVAVQHLKEQDDAQIKEKYARGHDKQLLDAAGPPGDPALGDQDDAIRRERISA